MEKEARDDDNVFVDDDVIANDDEGKDLVSESELGQMQQRGSSYCRDISLQVSQSG